MEVSRIFLFFMFFALVAAKQIKEECAVKCEFCCSFEEIMKVKAYFCASEEECEGKTTQTATVIVLAIVFLGLVSLISVLILKSRLEPVDISRISDPKEQPTDPQGLKIGASYSEKPLE